jgi:hypothetical protein
MCARRCRAKHLRVCCRSRAVDTFIAAPLKPFELSVTRSTSMVPLKYLRVRSVQCDGRATLVRIIPATQVPYPLAAAGTVSRTLHDEVKPTRPTVPTPTNKLWEWLCQRQASPNVVNRQCCQPPLTDHSYSFVRS